MSHFVIPEGYSPALGVKQTEAAIKKIKDMFQTELSAALNLTRVSAPLFVTPQSGLNDNLNGVERPVSFDIPAINSDVEVVQSLAKWKRLALDRYDFCEGEGLYTDMNAIRRDEDTDNIHSIYVDQWDWEKIIAPRYRTLKSLYAIVEEIYRVMRKVEKFIVHEYSYIKPLLPREITFITSQELEDMFPNLTPKQREHEIARQKGAVFISQIGGVLKSGKPHDGRAPDYDDWSLNGDILVYYPLLDIALELSSMGIRVDAAALSRQLKLRGVEERASLPFQKALLEGKLPCTVGGGIGQSRLCMFFLRKAHIGEVQSSLWPEDCEKAFAQAGVTLL